MSKLDHKNHQVTLTKHKRLSKLKVIGEGGYGKIYKAEHKDWGKVAYKKLEVESNYSIKAAVAVQLMNEAWIHINLCHPNIVKMFGMVFEPGKYGLVLEFVRHGDLNSYLQNNFVPSKLKLRILLDIASGMTYLHNQTPPIIHGDLKIKNVLISENLVAKICDFGFSHWKEFSQSNSINKIRCGTVFHIPPEIWTNPCRRKVEEFDVYGYGILIWEVVTQKRPFPRANGNSGIICGWVILGHRPDINEFPVEIPEAVKDIMVSCWKENEKERPKFAEIERILIKELKDINDTDKHSENAPTKPVTNNLYEDEPNSRTGGGIQAYESNNSNLNISQEAITQFVETGQRDLGNEENPHKIDERLETPLQSNNQEHHVYEKEKPLHSDIERLSEIYVEDERGWIAGITWLHNRIYIVCSESKKVSVFTDTIPFEKLNSEIVMIKDMKYPIDMTSSGSSLFISDSNKRCLWQVQIPSKDTKKWNIGGEVGRLSNFPPEELVLIVGRDSRLYLDRYKPSSMEVQSIPLPPDVTVAWHAVKSSKDTFVVSYERKDLCRPISEIAADGQILRTFLPKLEYSGSWYPNHLAISENNQIFVAGYAYGAVYCLDHLLNDLETILSRDRREVEEPWTICYNQERRQLMVGQRWSPHVYVFGLPKPILESVSEDTRLTPSVTSSSHTIPTVTESYLKIWPVTPADTNKVVWFPYDGHPVKIKFDPPKDGNCQFHAVCNQLESLSPPIIVSPSHLREEAVTFLADNPLNDWIEGTYASWTAYLKEMSRSGTYGDHITLFAIAKKYLVQIIVLSTAGKTHTRLVTQEKFTRDLSFIVLGYYPENNGSHYVSLEIENWSWELIEKIIADGQKNANNETSALGIDDKSSPESIARPRKVAPKKPPRKSRTSETPQLDGSSTSLCSSDVSLSSQPDPETNSVVGITWYATRIYSVCSRSKRVYAFSDENPFERLKTKEFIIRELQNACDITACKRNRSLYVLDSGSMDGCLWSVDMSRKYAVSKLLVDGKPCTLSSNPSENLLVSVQRGNRHHLHHIYRSSNFVKRKSIPLPSDIRRVYHAVETSTGNFVVSYEIKDSAESSIKSACWISELTTDGNIIRSCDPTLMESFKVERWFPFHSTIDSDDNIYIASDKLFTLNSRLTDLQICSPGVERPTRLCYVHEKQQLLIAEHWHAGHKPSSHQSSIIVFDLRRKQTSTSRISFQETRTVIHLNSKTS